MELSTQKLERIYKELKEIVKFENSLHMMDMTLNQTDVNTLEDFDTKMNKVMEHYQASMGIDCDILGLEEAMNQKE